MENIFDQFSCGRLSLPGGDKEFSNIPWQPHPDFKGVEMKNVVTEGETGGRLRCLLVKIAPGKQIGEHIHSSETELHEVVAGSGVCLCGGREIPYECGVISVMEAGVPHSVTAGEEGLMLFAKFF